MAAPKPIQLDLALAVFVSGITWFALSVGVDDLQRDPDLWAYLVVVALGALMFLRRTAPVLTLLLTVAALLSYYLAGYPAIGLAIPVSGALFSVAEAGKVRWGVGVAGALFAISTYFRVREGDDLQYLLAYDSIDTLGLMAAAIALGYAVDLRRRSARQAATEREREAAARVEQERIRIARDVHDVLAHTVSVISLHADVAREALTDDADAAETALRDIRAASSDAARELRATVGLLRAPADHTPTGSLAHLPHLIRSVSSGGLTARLRVDGDTDDLPAVLDTTVYRIVQEALTNTVRHACAHHVDVVLSRHPDTVEVEVTDDGKGASGTDADAGHGLAGMRERAELLGGTLRAGNHTGRGFRVAAVLPVGRP